MQIRGYYSYIGNCEATLKTKMLLPLQSVQLSLVILASELKRQENEAVQYHFEIPPSTRTFAFLNQSR